MGVLSAFMTKIKSLPCLYYWFFFFSPKIQNHVIAFWKSIFIHPTFESWICQMFFSSGWKGWVWFLGRDHVEEEELATGMLYTSRWCEVNCSLFLFCTEISVLLYDLLFFSANKGFISFLCSFQGFVSDFCLNMKLTAPFTFCSVREIPHPANHVLKAVTLNLCQEWEEKE